MACVCVLCPSSITHIGAIGHPCVTHSALLAALNIVQVPVETYVVGPSPQASSSHNGSTAVGSAGVKSEAHTGAPTKGSGGGGSSGGICFMPFSEGPRNCVGQTLAKLEVVTVLAQLLGSFLLELAPEVGWGLSVCLAVHVHTRVRWIVCCSAVHTTRRWEG
jgi:hypothetical protein